jgi:GTP cyclohydrolase IA
MNLHDDPDDIEYQRAMKLQMRQISDEQFQKFEGYAAEIFSALGMDVTAPSTKDTPRRFIKALFDATEGYDGDPKLLRVFETECHGDPDCRLSQVMEGPIPFYALCEHHALPFYGNAYVGYIAHENIIGISKLTRMVRLFSKRFAVQERIGQQIADTLETMLHPHGVAVFLEAHHLCMEMRGVRETAPITRTTVWRGNYANDASLRSEFFTACGLQRNER